MARTNRTALHGRRGIRRRENHQRRTDSCFLRFRHQQFRRTTSSELFRQIRHAARAAQIVAWAHSRRTRRFLRLRLQNSGQHGSEPSRQPFLHACLLGHFRKGYDRSQPAWRQAVASFLPAEALRAGPRNGRNRLSGRHRRSRFARQFPHWRHVDEYSGSRLQRNPAFPAGSVLLFA